MHKTVITGVENGWIVTREGDEPVVFQDEDMTGESQWAKMAEMIFYVAEKCGYSYNKYGSDNMKVLVNIKGHKVDDEGD